MKLNISKRSANKKSDATQLRNLGKIPAIIYVRGQSSEPIAVDAKEFEVLLRNGKKGGLATTRMTLVGEGKTRQVIVKEIQYHPTTYQIIHLDFEELIDGVKISVNIPIDCVGEVDCVGIKLGGVLRQVIRALRVECYPKDMPASFELDIRSLGLKQVRRLKDLVIPSEVRPLVDLNEVAVVIAKR